MRKSRLVAAFTVMLAASLAVAAPAAAAPASPRGAVQVVTDDVDAQSTDGTQYANPGSPSSLEVLEGTTCQAGDGVTACFQRYGDIVWVHNYSGGNVVRAHWSNWLWDGDSWEFWRNGDCVMEWEGWGYCNKDFYEDSSVNAYGSTGSGIRVYPGNWDLDHGYKWVRNSA